MLASCSDDKTVTVWKWEPTLVIPSSSTATTTTGGQAMFGSSQPPDSTSSTSSPFPIKYAVEPQPPHYLPIADYTKDFTPTKSCSEYLLDDANQLLGSSVPRLTDIVQESGKITQSKQQINSAPSELEPSQLFACVCYTFDVHLLGDKNPEENFYYQLNKVLQTRDPAKLYHLQGYLYFLMGGLKALPSYQGVVYRGLNAAGLEVVKEHYRITRKIHWSGLSSTSEEMAFAQQMAGPEGVVLKIQVHTDAKKIARASALEKEREVLLMPNFCAIVISKIEIDPTTGIRLCSLAEVEKDSETHKY